MSDQWVYCYKLEGEGHEWSRRPAFKKLVYFLRSQRKKFWVEIFEEKFWEEIDIQLILCKFVPA